jgi:membrane-associated phospholipid phosphatase
MSLVLCAVLLQAAPHPLRWEPTVDIPITGAVVAGWAVSELALKPVLAPNPCRWCQTNAFDSSVRSLFNPSLMPSPNGFDGMHAASNVLGFLALPLSMVGLDAFLAWRDGVFERTFFIDVLLMIEATFSSLAVNQVVKFSVGRARPYTEGATPELTAQAKELADNNLSFFSGHSNFAFTLVASAATIAHLRGYRWAWLLWAVGLPAATGTAVLRMAADKHWATDVLVGSAMGLATGILMPTLLHGRAGPLRTHLSFAGNGLSLSGSF